MIFTINPEECIFCGICAEECPPAVITISKTLKSAEINHEKCMRCSHCGMVCPAGAVRVDGRRLEEYPAEAAGISGSPADGKLPRLFEHMINSKRSVRHYRPDPISREDLRAIMLAGSTTATASNSMQVKHLLIEAPGVREISVLISGVLLKAVNFGLNPAGNFILKAAGLGRYANRKLLLDYRSRIIDTIEGRNDVFFFNAPAVVILTYPKRGKRFGRTDCALAGQNMMLTAHSRGIGSCMIGFAEAALFTAGLRQKAGVPKDRRIGLIFTMGYTDRKYYRYPEREKWSI